MKKYLFLPFLLIISLAGKSQVKKDTVLWVKQDTVKPDTIFLPDGVVSHYDSSFWLPTVSIDPIFMADFALWAYCNFVPHQDNKGRYWHRRKNPHGRYTDKDIFDLFNKSRKKP